ncbi:MAG: hypothetical protein ACRC7N_09060 [Clostridium sp.]
MKEKVISRVSLRESMVGVNGYFSLIIITPEQYLENKTKFVSKWLPVASVIGKGLLESSDIFWAELLPPLMIYIMKGGFFIIFFKGAS